MIYNILELQTFVNFPLDHMDMYIQQDDYQQSMENLDLSLDDHDSRLLQKFSEDSLDNLLTNYRTMLADKEKSEAIKKQISRLSADAKQTFYKGLWTKLVPAVNQIIQGKLQFQTLKDSSIIELIMTAESRMFSLFDQMYKHLHKVLEKQTNYKNFAYLLKILHKIGKPLDKREQLASEMFELHKQIKQGVEKQNPTFAILNKYRNCSSEAQAEQKVYLLLLLVHFLSSNQNQQLRIAEEELRKLVELVKQKPYVTVLDFIVKYWSKSKKISRDIVGCDFKVENGQAKYIYNQNFLHPDLQTKETYLKALQTASEKIFQQLRKENFIIYNDKFYSKISLQALQKISQQSKLDVGEYSNEMLTQISDLMKYLLSNSSKKVANSSSQSMKEESIENEPHSTETVDQYLIYVWVIFSKFFYEHERNDLDPTVLFDKINVSFINDLLKKALELLERAQKRKDADLFAEELVKLTIHLLYKNEYAAQANYASDTSKLLQQVMLKMREFPIKWRNLKKIKAMLDKWGETITAQIPANISTLISKFIDTYFDERLHLKSRNFSHFQMFANQQYTRALGTIVSAKLMALLQSCITSLSKFPLSSASSFYNAELARTNGILYKMGCLYISRMKIPDNEGIADLVFRLYQNWAPQLNFIYSLRTWILHYSNKIKDGESLVAVNKMIEVNKAGFEQFASVCQKMKVEDLLGKFDKQSKQNENLVDFLMNLSVLVNNIELKQRNDIYGSTLYLSIIHLSHSLQFLVHSLHSKINVELTTSSALFTNLIIKNELSGTMSLYAWLSKLSNNLVAALRFLMCNLNRLLESKDQIFFLENCAQLLRQFAQQDKINEQSVKFVNDLFGFNDGVGNLQLQKGQSVGRLLSRHLLNNRDEFSFSKQDYTPLVIVSTLYCKLKSQYPAIIKNSLGFLSQSAEEDQPVIQKRQYICNSPSFFKRATLTEQQQKHLLRLELETLISSIYLPSINIFMVSQNNNKTDEKDREEEAFGILYDQFTLLIRQKISAKSMTCLHSQLSGFFQVCSDKQKKVINKQISAPQRQQRRPQMNQVHRTEILNELGLMGFEPQTVELAMEHVDQNDPDAIINWLQTNSHRLNQILTNRAIERSRNQSQFRKKSNKEESEETIRLSYVQFVKKVNQDTKQIIKLLVPELFSEHGSMIKKLIFVCLDSFQEETYKSKQLLLFAEMVCKQMDKLNSNFNLNILLVAVSSLEVIIMKRPDTIKQLHEKSAPYKLLSFMDKCSQEVGEKILSVVNATLPTPTDKSSPVLKEYLNYIGDILLTSAIKSEQEAEILCKMVKAKDQAINEKVLRIICKGLSQGILREKLFSMITLVLDTDREFSMANIELQIKNFIIENGDLNKKERFVKLDSKKFGVWFTRYQDHQFLQEAVSKILVKKNGKLCYQHEKHNLFWSQTLDSSYFSYKLPHSHRILMDNLVSQIVKEEKLEARIQYIRELHKILDFYKLLLPYTMGIPVGNGLSFGEWILEKEFQRAKGKLLPFVTFMFLKNGIYLKKDLTYSDYLTAKLMCKYISQPQLRSCPYLLLLLTYLLHLKSFNAKSHITLSRESASSIKSILEHNLQSPSKMNPVEFALICQSLYLIYKKQMIQSLCDAGKYKIEDEPDILNSNGIIEKQVLNMDLYYSRRKLARGAHSLAINEEESSGLNIQNFRGPNGRLNFQRLFLQLTSEQGRDEGDDSETLQVLRRMIMLRDRSSEIVRSSVNLSSIFVPVQPTQQPPQQPPQQQQQAQSISRNDQEVIGQAGQIGQVHQESSTVQKKEKVEKEQKQMKMQEESKLPNIYLTQIIEAFESILLASNQAEQEKMVADQNYPRIPQSCLKETDLKNASFVSTLKEPRVSIDYKFVKNAIFRQRIANIAEQVVEPGSKWTLQDQETSSLSGARRQNPFEARVTIERDGQNYGLRRHVMNRLMGSERERDRDQAVQPINVNRLLGQMPQHQDPKSEQNSKEAQKKQMAEIKQPAIEQKSQKKLQQNEMKQEQEKVESQPQKQEQKIEQQKQQQLQQKKQMIPVSHQPTEVNPHQSVEQMVAETVQQPTLPVQQPVQTMVQEQMQPHREILEMMGLPQTFLRDAGIDIESFDSLPEDMQIEQLTVLMDNQHIRNQSQQNRPPAQQIEGEIDPNQVMNELQNQNAAFIASLDGVLRQQTLMQATPQFLLTLPPAMRAEAENYRQRQISQMLHEQQIQMEEERINRSKQPKIITYPELQKQQFPEIAKPNPENIAHALVLRFSSSGYKPEFFRILLENKNTQKKAVNSVICYLKNLEQVVIVECTYNKEIKVWERQETSLSGHSRKIFIEDMLTTIQDHITNCIYRDSKFLEEKHDLENFTSLELKGNSELRADASGYYPLFELIDLALDNHSYGLLNKLIKKATDLPKRLRKRIIRGIRDDKFNQQFYNSLEGISNSEKFKSTFIKQFPEDKPIKIQTLSKVLKYNFSKLPYLKQLHVDTLKKIKGTPPKQIYDFLNQIFSSYTAEDIKQIEPLLLEHKQTQYHIIKYLYQSGRSLDNQPIGLILKFPHLLDFETKRFIFQHNPKLHKSRHRCVIEVSRLNLFQQSFNQLMGKTVKELQGSIKVVFIDEQAEDAGGPKKQWFLSLSKQIFDPRYALFEPSSSGNTYQPNPKSYVNTEHFSYYKFIGRFIAKALCEGMLIDAFFTRSFYKMILGHELEFKDLEEQDYSFYKSMIWLKENPLKGDEDYTFSYIYDYFGKILVKELMPGGEAIKVTEENKADYIHKYTMAMMRDAIGSQIQKFLQGFYEILPKQSISFFEATELELLMSGMPSVNLKDLKMNTDYQGYSPNDQVIKWYWEILEEYTNEDLARLIQFITGTSKIPLEGFGKLQGMHGPQKISIHKDCHIDQLPKSHTCFNQLDLPEYPSKQMLKERLRVAITWGSQGFGFM